MTDKGAAIRGKLSPSYVPMDGIELSAITGLCFTGMGLKTCKSVLPDDDFVIREDLPYYTQTLRGKNSYCLECCSTNPKEMDWWQLICPVDFLTAITTNFYGYQFRFARLQTLSDLEVITCPLKRSACTYDGNTLVNCSSTDNTYLWSYTLHVQVVEHSDTFSYWKGVTSCSAVVEERNVSMVSGDIFRETIVMNFTPQKFVPSKPYNLLWLLVTGILICYPILWFFRTARCLVCNRRLILVPWPLRRCAVCLFVNADFPDPYVLETLELKGRRLIDGDLSPPLRWYHVIRSAFHRVCCCKKKPTTLATREILVLPKIEEGVSSNGEEANDSHDVISGSIGVDLASPGECEWLPSYPLIPSSNSLLSTL